MYIYKDLQWTKHANSEHIRSLKSSLNLDNQAKKEDGQGFNSSEGTTTLQSAQQHKSTAEKRDSRVIIIHDGGTLVKEEGENGVK